MPLYSFSCSKCHEEFTKLVRVEEKDRISCPHCGSGEIQQLFRAFNYVKITQKYDPGCRNINNCVSAKRFGCGKYAKDPVPPISDSPFSD